MTNDQIPMTNGGAPCWSLVLGHWSFVRGSLLVIGAWSLVICARGLLDDFDLLRGELVKLVDQLFNLRVSLELLNPQFWQVLSRQLGEIGMTALRKVLEQARMWMIAAASVAMHLPFLKPGPTRRLALFALFCVIRLKILAGGDKQLFQEWGPCFAGHLAALALLLAFWGAWGPAPAWRRWGIALLFLGFAIYVELILDRFGFSQYVTAVYPLLLLIGMVALVFTAILGPLRDCFGSELLMSGIPSNPPRLRLLHLFGWSVLVAVPLALIRWLGGSQDGQLRLLLNVSYTLPSILLAGMICVTAVYAKKWWILWTLLGVVVIGGAAWAEENIVCHVIRYFRDPQGPWPGYYDLRITIRQAHFGFTATLLADLIVMRLIGVRIMLASPRKDAVKSTANLALERV